MSVLLCTKTYHAGVSQVLAARQGFNESGKMYGGIAIILRRIDTGCFQEEFRSAWIYIDPTQVIIFRSKFTAATGC